MNKLVQRFNTLDQASSIVVNHITAVAKAAVSDKGFCTIVLAGGQTPRLAYKLLCERIMLEPSIWQQCHFFWGDERWVALNHPDSNFFMAHETLFSRAPVPLQNIHPIQTGHQTPAKGAEIYEKHLRNFFHTQTFPRFDLILLGMGTDGHTASLFPGSGCLDEKEKWAAAVHEESGSPPVSRITLTLPVLNQAKNVLFLISGKEKRNILDTILDNPEKAADYPAAHVKPEGKLIWVVAEEE